MAGVDKRDFVAHMYDTPRWRKRVAAMSDGQVFAIYMSEQRKQEKAKLAKKKQKTDPDIPF